MQYTSKAGEKRGESRNEWEHRLMRANHPHSPPRAGIFSQPTLSASTSPVLVYAGPARSHTVCCSKSGRNDTCVNNKLTWQYCRVNDARPNERTNTRSRCYSSCPAPLKLSKQEVRSAISLSLSALMISSSKRPSPNSSSGLMTSKSLTWNVAVVLQYTSISSVTRVKKVVCLS